MVACAPVAQRHSMSGFSQRDVLKQRITSLLLLPEAACNQGRVAAIIAAGRHTAAAAAASRTALAACSRPPALGLCPHVVQAALMYL